MARFTETSKQEVIDSIDAIAVAADYLRLEKKSGRYWGLCPFHQEKTPSFTVNPEKKSYYCFGCHKGGSIVNFIMEMENLSFPETMETLSKRFGIPLVYESGGIEKEKEGKKEEYRELYRRVGASFHHILMKTDEGERAKSYVTERGISIETIERFYLGFAPGDRYWLYRFLQEKGFSGEFLAQSGLFSRRYPQISFFTNRLIFPIMDKDGNTLAFGGRLMEGDGPKYLNSSESELFKKGRTLFALDLALPEIRRTKELFLTEGYMDVIALHQGGISNAVAPLGTAFTDEQAKLLRRWAEKVILMLDNDEAGQNAVYKAILTCRRNDLDCFVVNISTFFKGKEEIPKDPAEILQKFGPEVLKNSVKCSILDVDFIISRIKANRKGPQLVAFLFPYLDALGSEVGRDTSIGLIADAYGVERRAIWEDYNRHRETGINKTVYRSEPKEIYSDNEQPLHAGYELYMMGAVFVNPGLYGRLRSVLSLEDLEDVHARELYIILEEWYRDTIGSGNVTKGSENVCRSSDEPRAASEVPLERIMNGNVRDFILRKEVLGSFSNPEMLIGDGITRIKIKTLEKKRRELVRKLRNIANITSVDESTQEKLPRQADLLAEKIHVDAELTKLKALTIKGMIKTGLVRQPNVHEGS
ncbi:MAG: DNA primase [Treponema sp.]|jgi:DNA primase|nr:DNA primase [Treponema sp.]